MMPNATAPPCRRDLEGRFVLYLERHRARDKAFLGGGIVQAARDALIRAGRELGVRPQRDAFELPIVRLQMLWDKLRCLGTEALARLGLSLGGFQLILQSSLFDGVAFDPFSFQEDGPVSAEVDVGGRQVL